MEENQTVQAEQPVQTTQSTRPAELCPSSHLIWAILCTLLCCLPFGIVSIVKAVSVEKLWYQGYREEAKRASKSARNYAIWGAVISFLVTIVCSLLSLLGMGASFLGVLASSL